MARLSEMVRAQPICPSVNGINLHKNIVICYLLFRKEGLTGGGRGSLLFYLRLNLETVLFFETVHKTTTMRMDRSALFRGP